jgi:hypothetical protein
VHKPRAGKGAGVAADAPFHARRGEYLHLRLLILAFIFVSPPATLETQRTPSEDIVFLSAEKTERKISPRL